MVFFLMVGGSRGFLYWSSLSVLSLMCLPPVNACQMLVMQTKGAELEQFAEKNEERISLSRCAKWFSWICILSESEPEE